MAFPRCPLWGRSVNWRRHIRENVAPLPPLCLYPANICPCLLDALYRLSAAMRCSVWCRSNRQDITTYSAVLRGHVNYIDVCSSSWIYFSWTFLPPSRIESAVRRKSPACMGTTKHPVSVGWSLSVLLVSLVSIHGTATAAAVAKWKGRPSSSRSICQMPLPF